MTLQEWLDLQPVIGRKIGQTYVIADVPYLVNRTAAWRLSDYLVSAVSGGSLWFWPRG